MKYNYLDEVNEISKKLLENGKDFSDLIKMKFNGTQICVVDECDFDRAITIKKLNSEGYECVPCRSAEQFADVLISHDIGMIITDIIMPDSQGIEVLNILAKITVPCIVVSGMPEDSEHLVKAVQFGIPVLNKSKIQTSLIEMVKKAFGSPAHLRNGE